MNRTILLTGGLGYIGSHTAIELLQSDEFDVISIDNCSNAPRERLDNIFNITGKRLKNYEIDLCDYEETKKVFEKHPNIVSVIHFAAYMSVEESVANPWKYYHNNINSLLNVIKCCQEYGVRQFIFSSSCSVYGNVDSLPVSEDTPLQPAQSPYANTKLIAEQILHDVCKGNNLNVILLRYFNPVGAHISGKNGEYPNNKPFNLLPIIVEVAAGQRELLTIYGSDYPTKDGTCIRDYIHVSDIAKAHICAVRYALKNDNKPQCEIFNLGSGNGVSVQEIVDAFERVNDIKLNYQYGPRREGDVIAVYADPSKAKQVLGRIAEYGLDDMVSSAWKWHQYLSHSL